MFQTDLLSVCMCTQVSLHSCYSKKVKSLVLILKVRRHPPIAARNCCLLSSVINLSVSAALSFTINRVRLPPSARGGLKNKLHTPFTKAVSLLSQAESPKRAEKQQLKQARPHENTFESTVP